MHKEHNQSIHHDTGDKRITVKLPHDLLQLLDDLAQKKGWSRSATAAYSIKKGLESHVSLFDS